MKKDIIRIGASRSDTAPSRLLIALACLSAFGALAQDRLPFESNSPWDTNVGIITLDLATNSKLAWKLMEGVRTPPAKANQRSELERNAMGADMCREFIKRYPDDLMVGAAKNLRREYLKRTIEWGNTNRIAEFEDLFPKKDTDLARMRAYRVFSLGPAAVRDDWEARPRGSAPGVGRTHRKPSQITPETTTWPFGPWGSVKPQRGDLFIENAKPH